MLNRALIALDNYAFVVKTLEVALEAEKNWASVLEKALEFACESNGECPAVFEINPFTECKDCEGDSVVECWRKYYLNKAGETHG